MVYVLLFLSIFCIGVLSLIQMYEIDKRIFKPYKSIEEVKEIREKLLRYDNVQMTFEKFTEILEKITDEIAETVEDIADLVYSKYMINVWYDEEDSTAHFTQGYAVVIENGVIHPYTDLPEGKRHIVDIRQLGLSWETAINRECAEMALKAV